MASQKRKPHCLCRTRLRQNERSKAMLDKPESRQASPLSPRRATPTRTGSAMRQ